MVFSDILIPEVIRAVKELFNTKVDPSKVILQKTNPAFEGDITLVVFGLSKLAKKTPDQTADAIGKFLAENCDAVEKFNIVKGFLNLVIHEKRWMDAFSDAFASESFGIKKAAAVENPVVIEYSSPNTNKPLHLGHVRNNLLGWSVAEILKANGHPVVKVNLVNDRGIHICKSMVAWQKFAHNETPSSTGMKGDHFVGKYYVEFDRQHKAEVEQMIHNGQSREEAEKNSSLMNDARQMLRLWEQGAEHVMQLWKKMNQWVYDGFDVTYKMLGVEFDRIYYESETYIEGKRIVEKGLNENVFYRKPDSSIWIDLTNEGLDEKVLLRADGTSVYITQDLGTA